jgi:AcrR family transcriptional regulator
MTAHADADRRDAIIDHALALYAERGYHGVGMRAVARAVGVRESTLYHYFPTKEAIMTAIMDRYVDTPAAEFFRLLPDSVTARELLAAVAMQFLRSLEEPRNQRFLRLMLVEAHHAGEWARHYLERYYEPPIAGLTRALEQRGVPRAGWVAESFFGAVLSFVLHEEFLWRDGAPSPERAAYITWLAEQATRGLVAGPDTANRDAE